MITRIVLAIPFLLFVSIPVLASEDGPKEILVPFGYEYVLKSDVLGEDRTLMISLPSGYEGTDSRYTVSFDPDQHRCW